jgi:hypothetical protein
MTRVARIEDGKAAVSQIHRIIDQQTSIIGATMENSAKHSGGHRFTVSLVFMVSVVFTVSLVQLIVSRKRVMEEDACDSAHGGLLGALGRLEMDMILAAIGSRQSHQGQTNQSV